LLSFSSSFLLVYKLYNVIKFFLLFCLLVYIYIYKVMSAYRRGFMIHDSHHLQADCQEPASAPEPYAR